MPRGNCLACGKALDFAHADCGYQPPAWLSDPRVVQDYDVARRLGHGGMGETFLATHKQLHVARVLKSVLPKKSSTEFIQRFQEEARNASGLRPHANVATLHDYFVTQDGSPIAVWECIDGNTAADELAVNGAYRPQVAIELIMQVLDGLAHIHERMAHRDIKPANLMVERISGSPKIKIIDFGLAKTFGATTNSSYVFGTYQYMAPEAWDIDDVDRAARTVDIFAVGAVLYEFLIGTRAFPGTQPQVAAMIGAGTEPEWRGPLADGLPRAEEIRAIIRRALARRPADRYQTAGEFKDDLRYSLERFRNGLIRAGKAATVPSESARTVAIEVPEVRPTPVAPSRAAHDSTDFFLRAYLEELIESNKGLDNVYVPLAGRTKTVTDAEPWRDGALGAAAGLAEQDAPTAREVRLEDVSEALNIHRQFYIAGEPGAGKTMSLMAIELSAARRYLASTHVRFPLRIDASAWKPEDETFDALVERELDSRTRVKSLPPARLLLLIDAVIDSAASPHDQLDVIEAWLRRYRGCAAVLAVRSHRSFGRDLPIVVIESLDDSRVRTVVKQVVGEEKGAALLAEFDFNNGAARDDPGIGTLARNPFNLSLICELQSKDRFPATRAALIWKVLATKYNRESRGRIARPAWDAFVETLGTAAIGMIRNSSLSVDRAMLLKLMAPHDVDAVLSLAADCDVIGKRKGTEQYEFKHRLYLEYFGAEYLRIHRAHLENVLEEPRYADGQRAPRRFDEVVSTLVQLAQDVQILRTIAAHDPFLAASCLPFFAGDDDDRSIAESVVVGALTGLMSDSNAREHAIAALASIGVAAVMSLRRLLSDERPFVRRGAVRALAQIPHTDAIEALLSALDDSNRWVRDDARGAIRRFDTFSRALFVRYVRTRVESLRPEGRENLLTTLEDLIVDLQPEFSEAIATAVGIDVTPADETLTEDSETDETETGVQDDDENWPAAVDVSTSWGFRWLEEWQTAPPSDRDVESAGRAWLRATPLRDRAWAFVWKQLWDANRGDHDLEWLGRDWLKRVPSRAGSWSHIWCSLFTANANDETLAQRGLSWFREVSWNQPGWGYVWFTLWAAKRYRSDLMDLGWWWLDVADVNHDSRAFIWMTLWDLGEKRDALERIGNQWLTEASPENRSWGFVWPRLWKARPGDASLHATGREWLKHAPVEHPAWGFIWPSLWQHAPREPELDGAARRWLQEAPTSHGGWSYVWDSLWEVTNGDAELEELARTWLSGAPATHRSWSHVWSQLWDRHPRDEQLAGIAREWLGNAPAHAGWVIVGTLLLREMPGDAPTLALSRFALDRVPKKAWPSLWMALWDHGGDREELAQIGRAWLLEHGHHSGGFSPQTSEGRD